MFRPNQRHASDFRHYSFPCRLPIASHLIIPADSRMARPSGLLFKVFLVLFARVSVLGGEKLSAADTILLDTNSAVGYNVRGYVIEGRTVLSTNVLVPLFAKYAGTNITIQQLIHAASDLESEYVQEGFPAMNI